MRGAKPLARSLHLPAGHLSAGVGRLVWFVGLWAAGVTAVGLLALLIRLVLH